LEVIYCYVNFLPFIIIIIIIIIIFYYVYILLSFIFEIMYHISRYASLEAIHTYCEYLFNEAHQSFCIIKSASF